jgi:5'-3' exonuclease
MTAVTTTMYLDAPSLIYRAFFAVPKTITNAAGQPVNAVRGVMEMIARLKIDHSPDQIVAALDADWRPAFRVEAYAAYKVDRPDEPEELTPQFEILGEVLDVAGIPRVASPGYEADDAIATLCARVDGNDRALVVTGDRDLICLVRDPHVSLLFTVRGVSELKRFDEAAVEEAYGIRPGSYVEFAMLRGDPSDGLPGVKGVGPKTAVALLHRYGSIAAIYDHLADLSPRQRAAFEDARVYLKAMRKVVPPVTDVELEITEARPPNEHQMISFGESNNLESPMLRLFEAFREKR